MPTRADRHLRAVRLAKDCFDLGARGRTIHHITGLPPRELRRLLFSDPQAAPRGRAPDSPEWYHAANLLYRAESSVLVAICRRLRARGFAAGEALVAAYRHYQTICQAPSRISFDRAFDLVAHNDGIWVAKSSSFSTVTCLRCGGEFLAAAGTIACTGDECPYCRLMQRFYCDPRIQTAFPLRPPRDPADFEAAVKVLICHGHPSYRAGIEIDSDRGSVDSADKKAGFQDDAPR